MEVLQIVRKEPARSPAGRKEKLTTTGNIVCRMTLARRDFNPENNVAIDFANKGAYSTMAICGHCGIAQR